MLAHANSTARRGRKGMRAGAGGGVLTKVTRPSRRLSRLGQIVEQTIHGRIELLVVLVGARFDLGLDGGDLVGADVAAGFEGLEQRAQAGQFQAVLATRGFGGCPGGGLGDRLRVDGIDGAAPPNVVDRTHETAPREPGWDGGWLWVWPGCSSPPRRLQRRLATPSPLPRH